MRIRGLKLFSPSPDHTKKGVELETQFSHLHNVIDVILTSKSCCGPGGILSPKNVKNRYDCDF